MNLSNLLATSKRQLLPLGFVALALAGSLSAGAQTTPTKEQLVVALSSPSKPGSLRVKQVSGSITIVGYNGKDVVIDAVVRESSRRRERTPTPAEVGGMRRLDRADGFELTAVEKENRVTISNDSWRRGIDLTIKVPQNFSLQVGTVNDGNITIENVNGELEISNVNGSIKLTDVSGSALLNTVNGNLTANFKNVAANAPMSFSNVNGKIDVTFPGNTKANLKLKSDRGGIYSDFEMAVGKAAKPTTTAQNGVYRISQESWTTGKINGGGAEITMKSLQGNLYIRKAK